mgnify:CR=1 FL=1
MLVQRRVERLQREVDELRASIVSWACREPQRGKAYTKACVNTFESGADVAGRLGLDEGAEASVRLELGREDVEERRGEDILPKRPV